MIHDFRKHFILGLTAIPYPVYGPRQDIPKEFLENAYGELAMARVYAREWMVYPDTVILQ